MSLEEYKKEKLWLILVETVHANVMYPTHKSYTRETILKEKPAIAAQELAARLNAPIGEAFVILDELQAENKTP